MREITDADGTTWSCVPPYQGLAADGEGGMPDAARVDGAEDRYWLVCTPSGGAQSVRISVPGDWERSMSDEQLAAAIRAEQHGGEARSG